MEPRGGKRGVGLNRIGHTRDGSICLKLGFGGGEKNVQASWAFVLVDFFFFVTDL